LKQYSFSLNQLEMGKRKTYPIRQPQLTLEKFLQP
jgi:hypothetical protein